MANIYIVMKIKVWWCVMDNCICQHKSYSNHDAFQKKLRIKHLHNTIKPLKFEPLS
jgi:hypothetical protein